MDGCLTDLRELVAKLQANWGHAAAQQLQRVLGYSVGDNMHLVALVDDVPEQFEVCRACDNAPHAPVAGASTAAMFSDELRVDLLFLDAIIAVHVAEASSKYSVLVPVRTKTP